MLLANKTKCLSLVFLLFLACGKKEEKASPNKGTGNSEPTSGSTTPDTDKTDPDPRTDPKKVAKNPALASAELSAQVDTVVQALSQGNEASDGRSKLYLSGIGIKGQKIEDRNCEFDAAEGTTTVTALGNVEKEFNIRRFRTNMTFKRLDKDETVYVWSKPGIEIPCNDVKTHINLPYENRPGLSLRTTFNRETADSYVAIRNSGEIETSLKKSSSSGSNEIKWDEVEVEGSNIKIKKSFDLSIEQTLTVINKDQDELKVTSSIESLDSKPLMIEEVRSAKNESVISRKIVSGTVQSKRKSGGYLEITYENVLYSKESRCQAVSGKLTGQIFSETETEPLLSFEIDFANAEDNYTEAAPSNAAFSKVWLSLDGCSFEEPEKHTVRRLINRKK